MDRDCSGFELEIADDKQTITICGTQLLIARPLRVASWSPSLIK